MVFHNFDELIAKVKGAPDKKIMAVACANDDHTLEAVVNARREGIIEPLLVGDKDRNTLFLYRCLSTFSY